MFSWLLPKETNFFDYFCKHASLAKKAALEMLEGPDVTAIKDIEHQADKITRECIEMLRKTFITPIDRNDIFHLISRMDDIGDAIYAAARCYAVYNIPEPTKEFKQFCRIILESIEELELAVKALSNFDHAKAITQNCINVKRLEGEGDDLLSAVLGTLFEKQNDLRQLIKWKEIYEHLEAAIDRCEDATDVIEGIILEHS
jgi:predicted phosphate transport protein (TIGR00153 family)